MPKLYEFPDETGENMKCPGCNWRVSTLFVLANDREQAELLFKKDIALCGECMSEMLAEEGYEIKKVS